MKNMTSLTRFNKFHRLKRDFKLDKIHSAKTIQRHEELENFLNILRGKFLEKQLQVQDKSKNNGVKFGK